MPTPKEIEESVFKTFIVPSKREHYVELLASKRGREKILFSLDHFKDLDARFCKVVRPSEQNPKDILRILTGLGAPATCYAISSWSALDSREMNLSVALKEVIGCGMGTFLSCIAGRLAYFEGEERNERRSASANDKDDITATVPIPPCSPPPSRATWAAQVRL